MLSPSFLSLCWCQGFHLGQWERCQPHASTQCHKHIVVEGKQFTHTNCYFKAHSLTFMYNPILSCINLDNTFMIYRCQSLRGEFMPMKTLGGRPMYAAAQVGFQAQALCFMSLPTLSPPPFWSQLRLYLSKSKGKKCRKGKQRQKHCQIVM